MRISVVIPVYNSVNYLGRCIDSVIAQSFTEKEIILVDDGSTDGSGEICDEYAAASSSVTVFHTENHGASLARRLGLEKAQGEYVTFVDSDDFVSPEYLSKLLELEEKFQIGISACKVMKTRPDKRCGGETERPDVKILDGEELFHRFFKYEFWGFWGKMYKRDILLDIPFPIATLSEDYYVMAHLFQKEKRMAYISSPLYYYEQHEDSLSHQSMSPRAFEEFINVRDVYSFTQKQMPEYEMYAFSNVAETAVKLLWNSKPVLEESQLQELADFLKSHRKEIIHCKPLNWKTAFLAFLLSGRA